LFPVAPGQLINNHYNFVRSEQGSSAVLFSFASPPPNNNSAPPSVPEEPAVSPNGPTTDTTSGESPPTSSSSSGCCETGATTDQFNAHGSGNNSSAVGNTTTNSSSSEEDNVVNPLTKKSVSNEDNNESYSSAFSDEDIPGLNNMVRPRHLSSSSGEESSTSSSSGGNSRSLDRRHFSVMSSRAETIIGRIRQLVREQHSFVARPRENNISNNDSDEDEEFRSASDHSSSFGDGNSDGMDFCDTVTGEDVEEAEKKRKESPAGMYSGHLMEKINSLPLPPSLKIYLNYCRKLN